LTLKRIDGVLLVDGRAWKGTTWSASYSALMRKQLMNILKAAEEQQCGE
jgi:hypothetical protein